MQLTAVKNKIGYARVSTDEQNLDLQIQALKSAGCDVIYTDSGISGSTSSRPGLDEALKHLQSGDKLVVWRLDRLGRSLVHLVHLLDELGEREIRFKSICEHVDTNSSGGRLVFHMMAALAEFERSLISERTRAGMAAARARGRHMGRIPSLTFPQCQEASILLSKGCTPDSVAQRFDVKTRTLLRLVRRFNKVEGEDASTEQVESDADADSALESGKPCISDVAGMNQHAIMVSPPLVKENEVLVTTDSVANISPCEISLGTLDKQHLAGSDLYAHQAEPQEAVPDQLQQDEKADTKNAFPISLMSSMFDPVSHRLDSSLGVMRKIKIDARNCEQAKQQDARIHFSLSQDVTSGAVSIVLSSPLGQVRWDNLDVSVIAGSGLLDSISSVVEGALGKEGVRQELIETSKLNE